MNLICYPLPRPMSREEVRREAGVRTQAPEGGGGGRGSALCQLQDTMYLGKN